MFIIPVTPPFPGDTEIIPVTPPFPGDKDYEN